MGFLALATVVLGALLSAIAFALVHLTPAWWARRPVRLGFGAACAPAFFSLGAWALGNVLALRSVAWLGVQLAWCSLALLGPLAIAMLAAGIAQAMGRRLQARARPLDDPERIAPEARPFHADRALTRRAVLQGATAALPAAALGFSGVGLAAARLPPVLRTVPVRIPGLPAAYAGLRVLQLTDLHLGHVRHLRHLERFLAEAAGSHPDLVVLTGDVADDLAQLRPALRLVRALEPRLGVVAALGNHEYFGDVRAVRRAYDASDVELLVDRGTARDAGRLWIAGVDDPAASPLPDRTALARGLAAAMESSPRAGALRVLLSHRPEGFVAASALGVHLTLAGHTHGGQVGLRGRSVFEPLASDHYLWGIYARGGTRLYTSSGFGHWLPFRVSCPAEAPLLVLSA